MHVYFNVHFAIWAFLSNILCALGAVINMTSGLRFAPYNIWDPRFCKEPSLQEIRTCCFANIGSREAVSKQLCSGASERAYNQIQGLGQAVMHWKPGHYKWQDDDKNCTVALQTTIPNSSDFSPTLIITALDSIFDKCDDPHGVGQGGVKSLVDPDNPHLHNFWMVSVIGKQWNLENDELETCPVDRTQCVVSRNIE